jgi:hypothetical protein
LRPAVPADFAATVSAAAHRKAADYTIAKARLGLLETAFGAAVLLGWTLLGGLNTLNQVVLSWFGPGMGQQLALLACFVAIAIGTLFGGWRIVKTMGQRITKLRPIGGFAAESGGAISLFLATAFGIPVSTTHTITGSIIGVGSAQRARAVRWGVAGNIIAAWVLTIPASALIAAGAWWLGWQFF